jgi:hypothetical protein
VNIWTQNQPETTTKIALPWQNKMCYGIF